MKFCESAAQRAKEIGIHKNKIKTTQNNTNLLTCPMEGLIMEYKTFQWNKRHSML